MNTSTKKTWMADEKIKNCNLKQGKNYENYNRLG